MPSITNKCIKGHAIFKGLFTFAVCFIALVLLLVYQAIFFTICIILSYGVESAVSHVHEAVFDMKPALPLETFITLLLMSCFAELHTEIQKLYDGEQLRNYPISLIYIPNLIYTSLYAFAFYITLNQFCIFHQHPEVKFSIPEENWNLSIYMLAMSYIVYSTAKIIHKDIMEHAHRRPVSLQNWVVAVLMIFQVALTALYTTPLIGLKYFAIINHWDVRMEFMLLILISLVTGVGAGLMEQIWPSKILEFPNFWYESNLLVRVFILVVLWPWVHFCFFWRRDLSPLTSSNWDWIAFSLYVSVSLLHLVKILTNAICRHRNWSVLFGWDWCIEIQARNQSQHSMDTTNTEEINTTRNQNHYTKALQAKNILRNGYQKNSSGVNNNCSNTSCGDCTYDSSLDITDRSAATRCAVIPIKINCISDVIFSTIQTFFKSIITTMEKFFAPMKNFILFVSLPREEIQSNIDLEPENLQDYVEIKNSSVYTNGTNATIPIDFPPADHSIGDYQLFASKEHIELGVDVTVFAEHLSNRDNNSTKEQLDISLIPSPEIF